MISGVDIDAMRPDELQPRRTVCFGDGLRKRINEQHIGVWAATESIILGAVRVQYDHDYTDDTVTVTFY